MVLLQVLHPVAVVRPAPRTGRPRLHTAWIVSPLTLAQAEDGFLAPLPEGLAPLLTRPDRAQPFVERTLRLGPGGIWGMLRVPDPEELAAERERRRELDNEDGWGFDDLGDVVPAGDVEPHIRAATAVEAVFMLKGMETLLPRAQSWLRLTPFCPVTPGEAVPEGVPGPDPAEIADARARLSRWAEANLCLCRDALWIRFGVPALPGKAGAGEPCLHPAGVGLDVAGFADEDFAAAPRLASPISLQPFLAHARRVGNPVVPRDLEALSFGVLAGMAGRELHDGIPAAFVNLACRQVFAMAGRTAGKRASTEAATLRPSLDEAVSGLAPWAARGSTWSIEPGEWPEAIGAIERVARPLMRSHPWSHDVRELEALLPYAEDTVLPLVGHAHEDAEALLGLIPPAEADGPTRAPAFTFPAAAIANALVLDPDGARIGRLLAFTMGVDGRAVSATLKVGARRIDVPFSALSFAPGGEARQVVVTADPAALEGLVPLPAAPTR